MHDTPSILASLALLSPLATSAAAADELTSIPEPTGAGLHDRLHHDVDASDAHWVRGRDYKASASTDGFTYVPFLGSDAPRNFPTRFRLASAARSGTSMALTSGAVVARDGDRLTLDRGDVEVRYDCELESVEQSFVFGRVAGGGPLTLTIEVESELAVAPTPEGGFRFVGSHGGFDYGRAIAFDAEGRECEVPATWVNGAIELAVPADFMDAAVAPIVVDPIFHAFSLTNGFADLTHPDVAYHGTSGRFCVVYQEQFSGSDFDLVSVFYNPGAAGTTNVEYVDITSVSWIQPRVAWHGHSDQFLIIAQTPSAFVSGKRDVSARYRFGTGSLGPQFVLKAATNDYSCVGADVGSQAVGSPDSYFCIVYNRHYGTDRDVWAITFNSTGNYVGPETPISTSILHDEEAPRVSNSTSLGHASGNSRYVVAWPVRRLHDGASWIECTQLTHDGALVYSPFDIVAPQVAVNYFDVRVATPTVQNHPVTGLPYYVVTYDDTPSSSSDAFVALCSGDQVHSTTQLQEIEHADRPTNQSNLVVSTSAFHFTLSYVENGRLVSTIAQPIDDKLGIRERRSTVTAPSVTSGSLATASAFDGGSSDGLSLLMWHNRPGAHFQLHGAVSFSTTSDDVAGWQYCYGAPNSTGDYGFIRAMGLRHPAGQHTLHVEALPSNSFGFFLASTTQGNVPNAGGSQGTLCLGGSIGRFGIFNSGANGTAVHSFVASMIPQPTGTVAAASGETWSFQCWHRDSSSQGPTSNFTNAVAIPFL